jgi:hypothetical protein
LRSLRQLLILAALAVVAVSAYRYLSAGEATVDRVTSPDGRFTLEFRSASRWQRWTHGGADMPGYVRLRERGGETVSSPVFEMSGSGPVFWTKDGVQVGTSAIYHREQRRWSVDQ